MKRTKELKHLLKLHKKLQALYMLTTLEQEALDLCCQNDKDCSHITIIIDIILEKHKQILDDFERTINLLR